MGTYLNPGNSGFSRILNEKYVDKTELISLINKSIDTPRGLTCVSRPRRFGKSYAAQMLCAYYGKGCDSHGLFASYKISNDDSYEKYINKYDVIYLDLTGIRPETDNFESLVPFIKERLTEEIVLAYPDVIKSDDLITTLINAAEQNGNKFIAVIDEWDAPIRENPSAQKDYLMFLRSLFKNSGATARVFSAVYMTGILPIKKDGSQSALSDFKEFTMIKPRQYGEYVGFTEKEVKDLCDEHNISFDEMKKWYDGYEFKDVGSVYNPNSVMQAIENRDFDSYWTETSAAEGLIEYINKSYNGLTKTIAELIGGVDVKVDTLGFANDLTTFKGRDDVLTLLIHLGYLAYDSETGLAHIPNEEIRREFQRCIRYSDHAETAKRLEESDKLFIDTINGDEQAVAAQIEKIHAEETSPIHYNREDSLRSVIKLAYYTYRDHYLMWEELPAGKGFADVVYLPKHDSGWPALVVELKWDDSAEGAIDQILNKNYPDALKDYGSEIILVGVNYDTKTKKHECRIIEA